MSRDTEIKESNGLRRRFCHNTGITCQHCKQFQNRHSQFHNVFKTSRLVESDTFGHYGLRGLWPLDFPLDVQILVNNQSFFGQQPICVSTICPTSDPLALKRKIERVVVYNLAQGSRPPHYLSCQCLPEPLLLPFFSCLLLFLSSKENK